VFAALLLHIEPLFDAFEQQFHLPSCPIQRQEWSATQSARTEAKPMTHASLLLKKERKRVFWGEVSQPQVWEDHWVRWRGLPRTNRCTRGKHRRKRAAER
jgi:hypothetical protein